MSHVKETLSGVFAPTVTPFVGDSLTIDFQWIEEHQRLIGSKGATGAVPSGTNGEGPSMSLEERKKLIGKALEVRGGLKMIPGTGCAALPDAIELTRFALEEGADSVLVLPPFYFKNPKLEGLVNFFRTLCDKAVPPGKGIILYNIPQISAVPISFELLDALLESHPECIWGVKDSSGDPESLKKYVSRYPRLRIFAGSDRLASLAYRIGAAGTISAMANIVPDWLQELREQVQRGDEQAAEATQARIDDMRELLSIYPMRAATKYIIHLLAGLPLVKVRPPEVELTEEQMAAIKKRVEEITGGY